MATTRPPISQRDRPTLRSRNMETVAQVEGNNMVGGVRSMFGGARTGGSGDAPPPPKFSEHGAPWPGYNVTPLVDYGRERRPGNVPPMNSPLVQGSATTATTSWTTSMPGDYPQETVECGCCFESVPITRTATCSSGDPHHFCFTCATKMADEAIIKANYELTCMDVSGCSATFLESQIQRFLDRATYKRFDRLRTDNEIRKAGIEGLVYCPFCPYAAILDNPNDTQFECLSCRIKSCRTCRIKSHRGRTCQEIQAEKSRNPRQIVEEAMSEAMVRKCNKCGLRFTKLEGCNQMTCRCGNRQCFVCSKNVTYEHFSNPQGGGCPMYCDVDQLFDAETTQAKRETVQKLKATKPELKDAEIEPNVPDVPKTQQQPQMMMGGLFGQPGMMPMGGQRAGFFPPTIVIPPAPPPFMLPAGVVSPFGQQPPTPPMYTPPPYNQQQYWPPYQYPGMNTYPNAPPTGNFVPPPQIWNPYPTPPPTNGMPNFNPYPPTPPANGVPSFPNGAQQAQGTRTIPTPINPVGQYGQQKLLPPRAAPMQNVNYAVPPSFVGGFPPPEWPSQSQGRRP